MTYVHGRKFQIKIGRTERSRQLITHRDVNHSSEYLSKRYEDSSQYSFKYLLSINKYCPQHAHTIVCFVIGWYDYLSLKCVLWLWLISMMLSLKCTCGCQYLSELKIWLLILNVDKCSALRMEIWLTSIRRRAGRRRRISLWQMLRKMLTWVVHL